MNQEPLVSVLLPAYNAGNFITEAINSIISQTYKNLEIIIINDGSTDDTEEKINNIKDHRIKLFENEVNLGLIQTLNKGIELCNGKYIARMDADDISFPKRIELQVQKLEENSEYGICGTWFETYNGSKLLSTSKYNVSNDEIQIHLLYQIHLCHGTAIFRKEVLDYFKFDKNYVHAEDFELWSRIKTKYKMTNIPEILYRVNRHENNVSVLNSKVQTKNTLRIMSNQLEDILHYEVSEDLLILYRDFCHANFNLNLNQIIKIGYLINDLANSEYNLNLNNPKAFIEYLTDKWEHLCYNNLNKNKQVNTVWKQFSPIKPSLKLQAKFLIKNLIYKG